MSGYVTGTDISRAWVAALGAILDAGGDLINLSVSIQNPLQERPAVRAALDGFLAERRGASPRKKVWPVSTVANTLFPASLRQATEGKQGRERFYERQHVIHERGRRFRRGETYFHRLTAYQAQPKPINQVERVIEYLGRAGDRGERRGNVYELALYDAKRDPRPIGFPCLSHISLSLLDGCLHMTALYRNHWFLRRAYGNYLGLGQLLSFIADETRFETGELLCVSSHAEIDFGRDSVAELYRNCCAAMNEEEAA